LVQASLSICPAGVMITTFQEQSPQSLPAGAARHIGHKIRELLSAQAGVNVAMPGGRSMATLFGFLIQEEVEWSRVHFFSVDERLVPLDHPDSNYKLLHDHLLAPLDRAGKINRANAHPFVFDPAVADLGTRAYERVLAGHGSRFDLIVLSAGEDGHVGACFPVTILLSIRTMVLSSCTTPPSRRPAG
jgi:6-phosphogluconolactonase